MFISDHIHKQKKAFFVGMESWLNVVKYLKQNARRQNGWI